MDRDFRVSRPAQEIVEALKEILDAVVMIVDERHGRRHVSMTEGAWSSGDTSDVRPVPGWCSLHARVNARFVLRVVRRGQLHAGAPTVCNWAAQKLAEYFRAGASKSSSAPPVPGGGGTAGPAEMGIPVWWARRRERPDPGVALPAR